MKNHTEESIKHRLQGYLQHNLRTISMPMGMLLGLLFHRPIATLEVVAHQMITPSLIFLMLLITFCRVQLKEMRPAPIHGIMLAYQIIASLLVYGLLLPIHPTLAQGGMICILAPVAMAAVVIGGMLGANITTMATYSLICNLSIATIAPLVFSWIGNGTCTFIDILGRIAPLLVGPFIVAQLLRWLLPRLAAWIAAHSQLSFYLWLISLTIVIGRTTSYIIDLGSDHWILEIGLAIIALVICLLQFKLGRWLGRRFGDAAAGGQSLGQKNTVLAVWMAQAFLDPISSIAPTAYIVWQNMVNSWQIYRYDKQHKSQ